jgi:hypothetical protein
MLEYLRWYLVRGSRYQVPGSGTVERVPGTQNSPVLPVHNTVAVQLRYLFHLFLRKRTQCRVQYQVPGTRYQVPGTGQSYVVPGTGQSYVVPGTAKAVAVRRATDTILRSVLGTVLAGPGDAPALYCRMQPHKRRPVSHLMRFRDLSWVGRIAKVRFRRWGSHLGQLGTILCYLFTNCV